MTDVPADPKRLSESTVSPTEPADPPEDTIEEAEQIAHRTLAQHALDVLVAFQINAKGACCRHFGTRPSYDAKLGLSIAGIVYAAGLHDLKDVSMLPQVHIPEPLEGEQPVEWDVPEARLEARLAPATRREWTLATEQLAQYALNVVNVFEMAVIGARIELLGGRYIVSDIDVANSIGEIIEFAERYGALGLRNLAKIERVELTFMGLDKRIFGSGR